MFRAVRLRSGLVVFIKGPQAERDASGHTLRQSVFEITGYRSQKPRVELAVDMEVLGPCPLRLALQTAESAVRTDVVATTKRPMTGWSTRPTNRCGRHSGSVTCIGSRQPNCRSLVVVDPTNRR